MFVQSSLVAFFFLQHIASGNGAALGKCEVSCLRNLLETWEQVRSSENQSVQLVLQVPFYGRDSLLSLCDAYQSADDACALSLCQENHVVSFINRHLSFICGPFAPAYFEKLDCITKTFVDAPSCSKYLAGEPDPAAGPEDSCPAVGKFVKCIESTLLAECGSEAHSLLLMAIENFGCGHQKDLPKLESALAKVNISGKFHQISSRLFVRSRVAVVEPVTHSKPQVQTPQKVIDEPWTNNEIGDVVKSGESVETEVEEGSGEGSGQESLNSASIFEALSCATPLLKTWSGIKHNRPEMNELFFPTYRYTKVEVLELCDGYANFVSCAPAAHLCIDDDLIRFTEEHLGFVCAADNVGEFVRLRGCIDGIDLHAAAACNKFIRGDFLPSDQFSNKCRKVSRYVKCMQPLIENACGSSAVDNFLRTIRYFGCSP